MAKIWASGFQMFNNWQKLPQLCLVKNCLNSATEWVDSKGYCVQHKPKETK